MNRRHFLAATGVALATPLLSHAATQPFSVGIIGHTGRGNFGHALDSMWLHIPGTKIAAVADANPSGLSKAKKRLGTNQGFSDYRTMLEEVRPDIVAVCPRHADQHRDMGIAAARSGAKGIYMEKPYCRSPEEADQINAACQKANTKLAIAHRNRHHPTLKAIDRMLKDGTIGQLLEIRARGKGDRRGGGEDLWVLGSHVLDLVHYFGGRPETCSAVMLQDDRKINREDVRNGNEGLGLLAGNELHARYELDQGVVAYFDSIANDGTENAGFGLQLVGSNGIVNIQCDRLPLAHLIPGNPFKPTKSARPWIPITSAGPNQPEPIKELQKSMDHHLFPGLDLVAAIHENRNPIGGPNEATITVEMICAVFESQRQGGKPVDIPLQQRKNALSLL